jgi:hypothetical protein
MKRQMAIIGLGAAGILVAAGLSFGAFALAGKDLSQPANPSIAAATPALTTEVPESPGGDDDKWENPGSSLTPSPGSGSGEIGSESPSEADD